MIYANDFAPVDDKLRVWSVSHRERAVKADSFIISYGKELYLIDGGINGTFHTIEFLLKLRKKWLTEAGQTELIFDINCKLRINQFISHFHSDHVEALLESVIPSPYIDYGDVYYGETCKIPDDLAKYGKNGDIVYRPRLFELLKLYHPNHKLHEIPFGTETFTFTTHTGLDRETEFLICPLPFDPGERSYLEFMLNAYAEDGVRQMKHVSTYTLNSASIWIRIKLGKRTFLFTGDTMKRRDDLTEEACDIMMKTYRELIGDIDVVKYVHHGYIRNPAAKDMMSFNPEYILVTAAPATGPDAIRAIDPKTKIKFVNSAFGTAKFICSPDGTLELEMLT